MTLSQANHTIAHVQLDKKDKPELGPEADIEGGHHAEGEGEGHHLSRREEKAPAREEPTTGESSSTHAAGAGGDTSSTSPQAADVTLGEVAHAPAPVTDAGGDDDADAGQAPEPEMYEAHAPPPANPIKEKSSVGGGFLSRFTK